MKPLIDIKLKPDSSLYIIILQGWEFIHSLIAHSLICSNRSEQMSECERFVKVTQDKWATVRESLRSLMTNERMWAFRSGHSGEMREWANRSSLFRSQKNEQFAQKNSNNRIFCMFLTGLFSWFLEWELSKDQFLVLTSWAAWNK